jgi:hypothetical protein
MDAELKSRDCRYPGAGRRYPDFMTVKWQAIAGNALDMAPVSKNRLD